ncbi:MAG: cadherin-like beta sandwich domain-containing protein, partial [Oscillospiraceae bacterium]|nr:cadherin-like beta sandwich domain-containing protein [Oscillospiraceae bacterium]
MKKIISILSVVMFLVIMILPMSASAITASGSLTGPSTVKQGGSFTVTFSMNGSGIESVNGSLSYDSSKMSLTGTKQIIASPWTISFTGNNFLAYDGSDSTALIKSSKSIFSATFKLKSGVAVGTKISVSVSGVLVSDHDSSYRFPSAPTYSATVVASGTTTKKATITTKRTTTTTKKSSATTTTTTGKSDTGAADLASININGVELKPAFDPKTTSYTAQVANNVKNLDVTAKAKDSSAKVDIGKTELDEGPNKIDITVKAANGEAKVYTLNVTRLALSSSRLASLI